MSDTTFKARQIIAVIEDEPDILELVTHHLKKESYEVIGFPDAVKFYKFLENENPDLVVLDLMLPDVDGLEVCKYMKGDPEFANIPIIMLTAKSSEIDKVVGLELGADDYITKPFSPRELVARVKAVLRRTSKRESLQKTSIDDKLIIDEKKYEVTVEGKKISLTNSEFNILKMLTSKIGWVFSREQILENLWGDEKYVLDRTVDVHIKNLRDKLGLMGKCIKNVRGVGYKFEL